MIKVKVFYKSKKMNVLLRQDLATSHPRLSAYSAQTLYSFHAMSEMGNNSVATGIALGMLTVCRGDCPL